MKTILSFILIFNVTIKALSQPVTFYESKANFNIPEGFTEGENLIFGYATVPEFYEKNTGKTFDIGVLLVKSFNPNPKADPFTFFNGGPGDSNIGGIVSSLTSVGSAILQERDIIVIESRGTFFSKPNLILPEVFEKQIEIAGLDLTSEQVHDHLLKGVQKAKNRLDEQGVDVSAFTTKAVINDFVQVLSLFGYEKVNIFGSSAGTMFTQQFLTYYPERVRSVIMNGYVPILQGLKDMKYNAVNTLSKKLKDASLEEDFFTLLDNLKKSPVMLETKFNGEPIDILLNANKLSIWIFGNMYYNPHIDLNIKEFIDGNFSAVANDPGAFLPISHFSYGFAYSIVCSEQQNIQNSHVYDASYESFVEGFKSSWFSPDFNRKIQNIWNMPEAGNLEIPETDIPALILSGEFDHVCPPRYGTQYLNKNPNTFPLVFPDCAHSPIDVSPCAAMISLAFLNQPLVFPELSCFKESGIMLNVIR